jgi:hypothetical protein
VKNPSRHNVTTQKKTIDYLKHFTQQTIEHNLDIGKNAKLRGIVRERYCDTESAYRSTAG